MERRQREGVAKHLVSLLTILPVTYLLQESDRGPRPSMCLECEVYVSLFRFGGNILSLSCYSSTSLPSWSVQGRVLPGEFVLDSSHRGDDECSRDVTPEGFERKRDPTVNDLV